MTEELNRLRQAYTDAHNEHRQALENQFNAKKAVDIAAMAKASAFANVEAYRKQKHEELDREMDGQ